VLAQFASLAAPGDAAGLLKPAVLELVEVALHRARRDVSQGGNLLVREALVFQPQHFHFALHARVGMMISLMANLPDCRLAESKGAHGCHLPRASLASTMTYGNEPPSTTLPDSAA
jgi:hypothetical protein